MKWLRSLLCQFIGHDMLDFQDFTKRRCIHCGREEWLHENPYPRIGEPKYFWKHMDWDRR